MISRMYGSHATIMTQALTKIHESQGEVHDVLPIIEELPHINFNPGYTQNIPKRKEPEACVHFLLGNCKYGSRCRAYHSSSARRPLCRFYPNCTKGSNCIYSYGRENDSKNIIFENHNPLLAMLPVMEEYTVYDDSPLEWFEANRKHLMMLGEGNFKFTSVLSSLGMSPAVARRTSQPDFPVVSFQM